MEDRKLANKGSKNIEKDIKEKGKFLNLNPSKDVSLGIYEEALDFSLDNEDIKNVAISGSYGSGKSSVIETYLNNKSLNGKEIKSISISLAHFNDNNNTDLSSTLEGKIINQLIHQTDPKNIQETLFKVKDKPNKSFFLFLSFSLCFIVSIILINTNFSSWNSFVASFNSSFLLKLFASNYFRLLSICLAIACVVYIVYRIILLQNSQQYIKKASAKGIIEIEVLDDQEKVSYFDKYLNEVLYIFRNSGADVIIFEDIDRFNDNIIFEKLREINTLINNKIDIDNKVNKKRSEGTLNKMMFMYLLKDDVFSSKDRTKFFDFIIPIIPVVDSSNAFDKLIEHLPDYEKSNVFNHKTLFEISLYIDDYRVLKNIHNEFLIYNEQLHADEYALDRTKLFGMILYKNIFPKDFANLQLSKGYVRMVFDKLEEIREEEISKIDKLIKEIDRKIDFIEDEVINDISKLEYLYTQIPSNLKINGVKVQEYNSPIELIKDLNNVDSEILETIAVPYSYNSLNYEDRHFDVANIFDKLKENEEYQSESKKIEYNTKKSIESLSVEKQELVSKRKRFGTTSLNYLISKENKESIFSIDGKSRIDFIEEHSYILKNEYFPLIQYLISSGLIDERSYSDYMSYFYPNSISQNDKVFLRSLTDQVTLKYEYSIDSPSNVVNKLDINDFRKEEILNYDIISYLVSKKIKYEIYLETILTSEYINKKIVFFANCLARGVNTVAFSKLIDSSILSKIIQSDEIVNEEKVQIIRSVINSNEVYMFDEMGVIEEFVSSSDSFISDDGIDYISESFTNSTGFIKDEITREEIHEDFDLNKIVDVLESNKIKHNNLSHEISHTKMFKIMYEKNIYSLNLNNIEVIILNIYGIDKNIDIMPNLYSIISSNEDQPLSRYVEENIVEYLEMYLSSDVETITDSETNVIKILNLNNIKKEIKVMYVKKLTTKIRDISSVTDIYILNNLFEEKVIVNSPENIFYDFFREETLSDTLIDFINEGDVEYYFDSEKLEDDYGENAQSILFRAFVTAYTLNDDKYKNILENFNRRTFTKLTYTDIPLTKILILFRLGAIKMNDDNLNFIRENYSGYIEEFILTDTNRYISVIQEQGEISHNEVVLCLSLDAMGNEDKITLMSVYNDDIDYSRDYHNEIKIQIINNYLLENDIYTICDGYSIESSDVRRAILSYLEKKTKYLIDNDISVEYGLLIDIIKNENITKFDKLSITTNAFVDLNINEQENVLSTYNDPNINKVMLAIQAEFEINTITKVFLDNLKLEGFISSYGVDRFDKTKYRTHYTNEMKQKALLRKKN